MSARPSPGTPSGSHEPRTARSSRPGDDRARDARAGTSRPGPASPVASRPVTASPAARPEPALPARPSTVQIVASVLTAVTSTVALSYLGVAGTLVGAAVAAILTAFANYAYTRSLVRTQVVVTQLAPRYLRTPASVPDDVTDVLAAIDVEPAPGLTEPTVTTGVIPAVAAPEVAIVTRETPVVVPLPPPTEAAEPAGPATEETAVEDGRALMAPARRSPRRTFGVVALTSFVVIVLTLTVVELGLGRPLAKALQGVEGSGTTITTVRTRPTTPPPVEPSAPAPTQEPTEAPTTEPSPEPTEAPTDVPTDAPTDAPTDDATTPVPTETPEPVPTDAPTPTFPGQTGTPVPTAPAPQEGAELTGSDLTSEGGASGDVTTDEATASPTPSEG